MRVPMRVPMMWADFETLLVIQVQAALLTIVPTFAWNKYKCKPIRPPIHPSIHHQPTHHPH